MARVVRARGVYLDVESEKTSAEIGVGFGISTILECLAIASNCLGKCDAGRFQCIGKCTGICRTMTSKFSVENKSSSLHVPRMLNIHPPVMALQTSVLRILPRFHRERLMRLRTLLASKRYRLLIARLRITSPTRHIIWFCRLR